MKIEFSKEWCRRMAELEGDAEIGAGPRAVVGVVQARDLVWDTITKGLSNEKASGFRDGE